MVIDMVQRLAIVLGSALLAITVAACATSPPSADAEKPRPSVSSFEAWSSGNGTGAFFPAVGPAGGSGVRTGWPR
jgi:hypothetical protein